MRCRKRVLLGVGLMLHALADCDITILILGDHDKETMLFVGDATSGLEKVNAQLKASKLPLLTALNSH